MSRLAGLTLSIAIALAALPSAGALWSRAPAATGRITGTVTLSPALSIRKPRIRMYGDYGPAPAPKAPATSEFANVVIYLDSVPLGGRRAGCPPSVRNPAKG